MTIRKFKSLFYACFLWLITLPTLAATLIIEPDMGRELLLNKIHRAAHSIQLVIYNLTDKAFLNALLQQQKQGHNVEVIIEKSPYRAGENNKTAIRQFNKANIQWRGKVPDTRFIHQKTLLLDNQEAIVMTFNLTHSAFKKQRNFALVLTDPLEVNDIAEHFKADWLGAKTYHPTSNLIWSPENSREKIISLISSAKHELHIYAQSITDKNIISALEHAAQRGVKVTVVTSSKPSINGVRVLKSLHYYIHAKVFIIDNQTAVIGSINLTRTSLDQNRELAVITRDPAIIKQLQSTFAYDSGTL